MGAIEYLIFHPEKENDEILAALTTEENSLQRRQFIVAVTQNVLKKVQVLDSMWSTADASQRLWFTESPIDANSLSSPLNRLTNNMVDLLNMTYKYKVGHPLGYFARLGMMNVVDPQPNRVESWGSGYSIEVLTSTLRGLSIVFNGGDQLGYDDYLESLNAQVEYEDGTLAEVINNTIETSIAQLDALGEPLEDAVLNNPDDVDAIYQELRNLNRLIVVDMANNLGITLYFNDTDGD